MTTPLFSVEDLRVFHGTTEVVHGISFSIPEGRVSSLLGVNGAGKTATSLAMGGHLRWTGRMTFAGRSLAGVPPWERSRSGIALVQEGRRLFRELTVHENLGLSSRNRGKTAGEVARQLSFVHDLFPVLKRKANDTASRLSGGEQQMLAIGQGLMSFPRLLILDEPTAGIAPKIVTEMLASIERLRHEGYTTLVIDQSITIIRRVAENAIIMRLGHVTGQMAVSDIDDDVLSSVLT